MNEEMNRISLLKKIALSIPPLTSSLHKGSSGRIGVVGGSFAYTGAPFYAGLSSLRVGGDLCFVFCTEDAAIPIKTYSPELMVLPCLDGTTSRMEEALGRLDSLHSLIVGPGLGRDKSVLLSAKKMVEIMLQKGKPVVLDGDGLFLLAQDSDLRNKTKGTKTVVTPNKAEFVRLLIACNLSSTSDALALSKHLGVTVLQKGKEDVVADASTGFVFKNDQGGSNRRCGGQGDVLAGTLGVFLAWFHELSSEGVPLSAVAASVLVREANRLAFEKKRRNMVTPDVIHEIGRAFEYLEQ